jgi:glycosyltransferase involved in cell wall biosynthesis
MQPHTQIPPKFSVIIPNHNNSSTLKRAIQSAIHQNYPAHEIIVVDDGSTDESEKILEQFKDKIICIRQKNSGVSVARNNGARIATGEWLAFLDADDFFYPDRLRFHAEWIQDEPDLDFLLAEQESRSPNGEFLDFFMRSSILGKSLLARHKDEDRIPIQSTLFGELISDGFAEIRTLSVPKVKFLSLGGFPVEHKIGEDLYFFIRLFATSKKAGVVPHTLATYYIYETSALRRDALSTMRLFDATLGSLKEHLIAAPSHIRKGFLAKHRKIKLNLAYALLRSGLKKEAILTVAPSLFKNPSIQSIMDLVSICRGIHTKTGRHSTN